MQLDALAETPDITVTIYDASIVEHTPGKRLGPFHARALRLAAMRGTRQVVWSTFGGYADGGYTLALPTEQQADWTAMLADTGDFTYIHH